MKKNEKNEIKVKKEEINPTIDALCKKLSK